jgi:DNA helicase HerA-like ATPase
MRPGKKDAMMPNHCKTVLLGELVMAAFDIATQYSSDPRVVSTLAARSVIRVLRRAHKRPPSRQTVRLLPLVGFQRLLALEGAGRQPGRLSTGGGTGR